MLKVANISKDFGALRALNDISFKVEKGEIVGVIGANGAGKSTLFEVISGFLPPTNGQVFFKDKLITGQKPNAIFMEGIARSFQLTETYPKFSVFDTVVVSAIARLPLEAARKQTWEVLERFGLTNLALQRISSLTLAQQKLVEVARIANAQAEMWLLDELMAGLSALEMSKIADLIREVHGKGVTIVMIEHRLEITRELCSRLIVLNLGTKIADGLTNEVLKDKEVINSYLGEPVK